MLSPPMMDRCARKNSQVAQVQITMARGNARRHSPLWLPPERKSLGLRPHILENKPRKFAHPFQTGQGVIRAINLRNARIPQLLVQGELPFNVPSSSNVHGVLVVLREGVPVVEFRWAFRNIPAAAFLV
jgi:hypothetical protein